MIDTETPLISNLLGSIALALLLPYLDRMRVLRWSEHLWRVVAMHLAWSLWLGWAAFDGLVANALPLYHLFGLAGAALWISTSRGTWRDGPPEYVHSGPGALSDEPHAHAERVRP